MTQNRNEIDFEHWIEPEDPSIPATGIGIYEAFVRIFNARSSFVEKLAANVDQAEEALILKGLEDSEDYDLDLRVWDRAQRDAHRRFREKLVEGALRAFILDGDKRLIALPAAEWRLPAKCEATFIASNYVTPDDLNNPGPAAATIGGKTYPAFLLQSEFEDWFFKNFGPNQREKHRKKGSGSLVSKDMPLVDDMRRLVVNGEASGPFNAAWQLLSSASGAGTPDSKVRRLLRRYSERYGED